MITVIAGGTGSAKLVRALGRQIQDLYVISNVADNFWHLGLYICPDIDTIIYALSGNLDLKRGWGIKGDSFNFLKYVSYLGYETWFNIGDKDLTTHVIRTKMMREGYSLSSVTESLAKKYGLSAKIIPVTDDHVETRVLTKEGQMHLQEFWVKNCGKLKPLGIKYEGLESASVNQKAIQAIDRADIILIAPGNPVSSIGPIISHKSIESVLIRNRKRVLAVSPIIGTRAISGPAIKFMRASGIDASVTGVASYYKKFLSTFIISSLESRITESRLKKFGIKVRKANILMDNEKNENNLARLAIASVRNGHGRSVA